MWSGKNGCGASSANAPEIGPHLVLARVPWVGRAKGGGLREGRGRKKKKGGWAKFAGWVGKEEKREFWPGGKKTTFLFLDF